MGNTIRTVPTMQTGSIPGTGGLPAGPAVRITTTDDGSTVVDEGSSAGPGVTPVGQVMPGGSVQEFTATQFFESTGLMPLDPGQSVVLIIQHPDQVANDTGVFIGCGNGAINTDRKGWSYQQTGFFWALIGAALDASGYGYTEVAGDPDQSVGFHQVAFTIDLDSHVRFSVNGTTVIDRNFLYVPGEALDGTCRSRIGVALPGDASPVLGNGAATAGFVAFAIIDRVLSDTELQVYSRPGAQNRLQLLPVVKSDPDLQTMVEPGTQWDGTSATFVTGGSMPITFTKQGAAPKPIMVDVSELRVVPTEATAIDSVSDSPQPGYVHRETFARMRLLTNATRIAADTFGNSPGVPGVAIPIGVYADDAYLSSPLATTTFPVTKDVVGLPGAATSVVDVTWGQQQGGAPEPNGNSGAYVNAVRVPLSAAFQVSQKAPPDHRLLIVGDSIENGYTGAVPMQHASALQLRYGLQRAGVSLYVWGGQIFKSLSDGTVFANPTALARFLIGFLDGTQSNTILWQSVTNDYSTSAESAADHGDRLRDCILAVVAQPGSRPGLNQIIWGAFQRIAPASEAANGFGDTLGAYRTARQNVALLDPSTRRFVIGNNVVSNSNMAADGVHVTDAGNDQIYAAQLSLLQ